MARFTIELSTVVRNLVMQGKGNLHDYSSHDELIDLSLEKIFNFDYPIFDEKYRKTLERKIIKHYYTREINETPYQLWNFRLNVKLNEIMPYYNDMYKLNLKEYEIFDNVRMEETLTKVVEEDSDVSKIDETESVNKTNSVSTSNSTNSDKNVYSDTPSSKLGDEDYATNITDLTGSNKNDMTNKLDGNNSLKSDEVKLSNVLTTEDYVKTLKGKNNFKSNSDLLVEARNALQNLDVMVLKDLSDLFMKVYI